MTDNLDFFPASGAQIVTSGPACCPLSTRDVVDTAITYDVSDQAGNQATQFTRLVSVLPDTDGPTISLLGGHALTLALNDHYVDPGYVAFDQVTKCIDRDPSIVPLPTLTFPHSATVRCSTLSRTASWTSPLRLPSRCEK